MKSSTPMPSAARCSRCGATRIVHDDGTLGACSLVPGRDGKGGCPSPLYDYEREHGTKARIVDRPVAANPEMAEIVDRLDRAGPSSRVARCSGRADLMSGSQVRCGRDEGHEGHHEPRTSSPDDEVWKRGGAT